MRKRSIFVLCLVGILGASGCSSSSVEPSKKVAATSDSNSTNANTVSVNTGTQVGMPQPADANVAPGASTDELASNRMDLRLQQMRKSDESGPGMSAEQIAQKNARPAPDNSTFTSYLTDAGYEIRTFKSHPQLLKVEKKITPDGKQSIKVFLRDGKVIELPGQRIAVLASATAAHILEAAGIQPAPAQGAPQPGPPPVKKSGE